MEDLWYPAPLGTVELCIAFVEGKPHVRRSPVTLFCRTKEGRFDWEAAAAHFEPDDPASTVDSSMVLMLPSGMCIGTDLTLHTLEGWIEAMMVAFAEHVIEHHEGRTDDQA